MRWLLGSCLPKGFNTAEGSSSVGILVVADSEILDAPETGVFAGAAISIAEVAVHLVRLFMQADWQEARWLFSLLNYEIRHLGNG